MTIKRIDIFEYTTSSTIAAVLLRARAEAPPSLAPVRALNDSRAHQSEKKSREIIVWAFPVSCAFIRL